MKRLDKIELLQRESEVEVEPEENSELSPIDYDSSEVWERRLFRTVIYDKVERQKQLQILEQQKRELQEKEQQMVFWNNDLKAREAKLNEKLNEIKPLLPSILELQRAGVTFDLIMAYLTAINEMAALENIDVKTAAYNMIKEYRQFGTLRKAIQEGERYLSKLGSSIREEQQAIADLRNLRRAGFTLISKSWPGKKVVLILDWSPKVALRSLNSRRIMLKSNKNLKLKLKLMLLLLPITEGTVIR